MNKKKLRLFGWVAGVVVLAWILCVVALFLAEEMYGGHYVTTTGEAWGFCIGMTKAEVLNKYQDLNESGDILTYGAYGIKRFPQAARPAEPETTPLSEVSDHWKAYRKKFPILYQEFYFSSGKLTNIMTHIRFIEYM
ncbi:MAG: hypothetical protein ABL962_20745 [Fimbriimonadaceae bacterium]